jgi:tRNA(Ile)-lysidine synthase
VARPGRLTALLRTVTDAFDLPDAAAHAIALSGGADSAALAWLMTTAGLTERPVRALHVHHGWSGSDLMERAARAVAAQVGSDLDVLEVEVGDGASPEAMARTARYRALFGALHPGEQLLVAHTLDDQAETVLANVLRGAGPGGLAGMPLMRERLVRPLLRVRRDTLREIAYLAGLPFVDDPANLDLSLRRNFIRHRLLGVAERSAAPGVSASIARLAEITAEESSFLDEEATRRLGPDMTRPLLATAPTALARRHIRACLNRAGVANGVRRRDIDAVLDLTRRPGAIRLPSGASVRTEGQRLVVDTRSGAIEEPEPVTWELPGTQAWGRAWTFSAHVVQFPPVFSLSSWSEVFDADAIGGTATIRSGRAGDRVPIRGGSKLVSDVLSEARVPLARRAAWPVVEVDEQIVWVPGVRRADVGWVGTATRRYLCLGAIQEEM